MIRWLSVIGLLFVLAIGAGGVRGQTPDASDAPTVLWQVQAAISLDNPTGIPTGIALGADGMIYISDSQLGVRVFAADGKAQPPIKGLAADQITPSGIVTRETTLCMALPDRPEGTIGCFADDKLTLLTGARFSLGSPRGLAINAKGDLFALDVKKLVEKAISTVSVVHFDKDGKFVGSFVALDAAQLKGVGVVRIAASPDGNIYVVTDGAKGIYAFSEDGQLVKEGVGDQAITDLKPTAMTFSAKGNPIVAGKKGQLVFMSASSTSTQFGSKAAPKGEFKAGTFYAPMGMVAVEDRLYVIDQNEDHTQIVAIQLPKRAE